MSNPDGKATEIGCPGCEGVLRAVEEGEQGFVRYVCTIGHSYALSTLIRGKEEQLEFGMWAVVSVLAHLDMAYRELLARGPAGNAPEIEARIRTVAEHARLVRSLVERDRPPTLDVADLDPEVA
jgi:hypothetical protein